VSVPFTIELENGGAAVVSVVGDKVLLVVPTSGAVLTRAECEHLGDLLWAAGMQAEPPKSVRMTGHAQPITSVDDPRVRGG